MQAFNSSSSKCCRHAVSSNIRCMNSSWSPATAAAAAAATAKLHHTAQRRTQQTVRAAPEDETPPAVTSDQQPSTSEQQASRLSSVANSLGSQKAFVSEDEWRVMDKKVNKYPSQRVFTAIGTGGDDFKEKMLTAVEAVVGTVHMECVSERPSSGGKYMSVRIGPVWVETADQVIQVFNNMRKDERLKWYM